MGLPYMPVFIGDYLRDTSHLNTEQHGAYLLLLFHHWEHGRIPDAPAERAAIAKLTLAKWKAVRAPIERFFQPDGTQKRATSEKDRTERKIAQRREAGRNGGIKSGVSRAIKIGSELKAREQANTKQKGSERFDPAQAKPEPESQRSPTIHKDTSISSTSSTAERLGKSLGETVSAGLLATALPAGALARPPAGEQAAPPPSPQKKPLAQYSRAELDAHFHRKTYADLKQPPKGPCCVGWPHKTRKTA